MVVMEGNMKAITWLACIILAGCAANPQTLESVARTESARLAPPTRPFSSFASYDLRPMVLSEAVQAEAGKVEAAGTLQTKLQARIRPLLDQWTAATAGGRSGTLSIEPRLASLKIVSGGARFWAGAMAGDSTIDLDLVITDQATGQQIAKPRIARNADAMTGGWSIGKSDQNLYDYITSIAYQYLEDNY